MTAADCESEVRRFLYKEARLLDERAWRKWLDLWAEDAQFVMPSRWTVVAGRDHHLSTHDAEPGEIAYFDETKMMLEARVAKLETGMAWAEEPPSTTTRLIGNIEVEPAAHALDVHSTFQIFRCRPDRAPETFVGRRHDVLRPDSGSFQIARRLVRLNTSVLSASDLELFF